MCATTAITLALLLAQGVAGEVDPPDQWAQPRVWADLDGDGLEDLFLAGRPDRLLKNAGDGSFVDLAALTGFARSDSKVALAEDLDGDGYLDLVRLDEQGRVHLHRGIRGLFQELPAIASVDFAVSRVRVFDYDRDGGLDLWLEGERGAALLLHRVEGDAYEVVEAIPNLASAPGITQAPVGDVPPLPPESDSAGGGRSDGVISSGEDAATPGVPGARRVVPPGSGNHRAGTGGSIGTSSAPAGTPGGTAAIATCAEAVVDQATSNCVTASSDGGIGEIYVQDEDFNIFGSLVGIGTTAPQDQLHIDDGDVRVSGSSGREILLLDGQGDTAVRLDSSSTGTANDLELYYDGAINYDHSSSANGYTFSYRNAATGDRTLTGGSSVSDGSGFLAVRGINGASITAELDGDRDNSDDGVAEGELMLRSFGTGGTGGQVNVCNNDGISRFVARGGTSGDGAELDVYNGSGGLTIHLDGEAGTGADLQMYNDAGVRTIDLDSEVSGAGLIEIANGVTSTAKISLDGDGAADDGGAITVRASDGSSTVYLEGEADNGGGAISVRHDTSLETFRVIGDAGNSASELRMFDRQLGNASVIIEARDQYGTGSRILLEGETAGVTTIELDGSELSCGQMWLSEVDGSTAFKMSGDHFSMYDADGKLTQYYNRYTGSKSAVIGTESYGRRFMYAVEATGIWLEDYGRGRLVEGRARVDINPILQQMITVDEHSPLHVSVTMNGPAGRVWIETHPDHFVVHEQDGGTSTVDFTWRITARRRGSEGVYMDLYDQEALRSAAGADPVTTIAPRTPQDGDDEEGRRGDPDAPEEPAVRRALHTPGRPDVGQ